MTLGNGELSVERASLSRVDNNWGLPPRQIGAGPVIRTLGGSDGKRYIAFRPGYATDVSRSGVWVLALFVQQGRRICPSWSGQKIGSGASGCLRNPGRADSGGLGARPSVSCSSLCQSRPPRSRDFCREPAKVASLMDDTEPRKNSLSPRTRVRTAEPVSVSLGQTKLPGLSSEGQS